MTVLAAAVAALAALVIPNGPLRVGGVLPEYCLDDLAVWISAKNVSGDALIASLRVDRRGTAGEWSEFDGDVAGKDPHPMQVFAYRYAPGEVRQIRWGTRDHGKRAWVEGDYRLVANVMVGARPPGRDVVVAEFVVRRGARCQSHVEAYTAPLPLGDWKPTTVQLVNALDTVKHDYADWARKTGRSIRDWHVYRFQYYGLREKGRRVVYLNAFCSSSWEDAPEWKRQFVDVDDGGNCFFHAKVDA